MVDENLLGLLKKSHLFKRVREEDLLPLAEQGDKVVIEKGHILYNQGSRANFIYFIAKGKITHFKTNQDHRQTLGTLVSGDYLGLDAIFNKSRRISTAIVDEDSELYRFRISVIGDLIKRLPRVKAGVDMITKNYKMIWNSSYDWIKPDEILYYIARRHWIFLAKRFLIPLVLFLTSILFFGFGIMLPMNILLGLAIILFLGGIIFGIYNYLDWENDFCFLTTKRVGWVEKTLLISEDRREALVQSIRSVNIKSTIMGRTMGYGNVTVNTYSGSILMENISYPDQVMDLIEELRTRTDDEVKRKNLRVRIGLEKPDIKNSTIPEKGTSITDRRGESFKNKMARWSASFKMRLDSGNQITFHKHWIVLLAKIGPPFILLFSVVITAILLLVMNNSLTLFTATTIVLLSLFLGSIGFGWLVYQYVDWQNDIYRVTPDLIIDREKKPLGDESKNTAPLENILSVSVEKPGFLNLLFNYGNVIADVSGKPFIFQNIYDPVAAQQDIMFRMDVSRRKRIDGPTIDWIGIYHEETSHHKNDLSDIGQ